MTGLQDSNMPQDTRSREFHRERLSEMVDGMLSTDEARFLLRRMEHDDELADCWQRWQLYGDAMRGQAGRALPADFAQRVGRAIADDQAVGQVAAVSGRGSARRPFLMWGSGGALAATVALAALLGPRWMTPEEPAMPVAASTVAPALTPPPMFPPNASKSGSIDLAPQAATAVLASAAIAGSRTQKRHVMASSRALAADATPVAVSAASSGHASTVVASARQNGAEQAGHAGSKPWPSALVPGAPESDNIADYHLNTVPVSPFHPGFDLPAPESQPQPPAAATSP